MGGPLVTTGPLSFRPTDTALRCSLFVCVIVTETIIIIIVIIITSAAI